MASSEMKVESVEVEIDPAEFMEGRSVSGGFNAVPVASGDRPAISGKKKTVRPSPEQVRSLITFMEQYPALARGRLSGLDARGQTSKFWQVVAAELNTMTGCWKHWLVWKKYWSDKKNWLRKCVRSDLGAPKLTELDRQILKLLGEDLYNKTKATRKPAGDQPQKKERLSVTCPFEVVPQLAPGVSTPQKTRSQIGELSSPLRESISPLQEPSSPLRESSSPLRESSSPLQESSSPLRESITLIREPVSLIGESSSPLWETTLLQSQETNTNPNSTVNDSNETDAPEDSHHRLRSALAQSKDMLAQLEEKRAETDHILAQVCSGKLHCLEHIDSSLKRLADNSDVIVKHLETLAKNSEKQSDMLAEMLARRPTVGGNINKN